MSRLPLLALVIAPALVALPAAATPAVDARMPVIAASVSNDAVEIRMSRGVIGYTQATAHRTIKVEARDTSGRTLGVTTVEVGKRLTYASIPLTPEMASAAQLVVSTK